MVLVRGRHVRLLYVLSASARGRAPFQIGIKFDLAAKPDPGRSENLLRSDLLFCSKSSILQWWTWILRCEKCSLFFGRWMGGGKPPPPLAGSLALIEKGEKANFTGLVLGCIEGDFRKQIFI